ncbi:LURP-one-related family protein [Tissierella pigra]|uniref:LURP-one-related/scramblase family protein n=1 Tax=Tissierella pigra TaxID=2607614 RepID=UPI001C108A9F|nr:LURP-one-related family protein [Tissierella pigra]MBU5428138.1 LURP-one-related family protein [Tissierella pigra]
MRYLIKERIFSFSDSFTINDENGRPFYEIVGKILSIGNKLNLYDMEGRNLFYIEQKIFRFLPEYNIYEGENLVAKVQKEFTFFKPKFTIDSFYGNFTIDGDILAYNFNIIKDGRPIAWISKKFLSFSDTYSVDISDEENQPFILALVIVLDQVFHDNRNNN